VPPAGPPGLVPGKRSPRANPDRTVGSSVHPGVGFVRLVSSSSTRIVDGMSSDQPTGADTGAQTVAAAAADAIRASGELLELTRAECLRLLGSCHFGRLGVTADQSTPIIRPLNYLFDEPSQSVVFRTAPGTKLSGLLRGTQAAFEIDGIDPTDHTGWSVIILGATEEISSASEIRRLENAGLDVWAPGHRARWVRIRARTISGRRIVPAVNG
jgi:nitroimidazol reductase NimA-like FMN-containing flavoprotein (pyridoxamine 5'-phosphate oxidase superfamily)